MKNRTLASELSITTLFIAVVILLTDPLHSFMPSELHMTILIMLVVFAGLFIGVVWREKIRDERDGFHKLLAGRYGFIAGVVMLVAGIAFEGLEGTIDRWLIYTLAVMIVVKLVTLVVAYKKY